MTSLGPLPFVRVVLLDFNGGRTIVEAVEAVSKTVWPVDRLEIVCVDNGSTDGSLEEIERKFPAVVTIRNGRNLGFPGNNVAMTDLEDVDYVALVNSDALVPPTWLTPLVECAESDPGIGSVCPKILLADQFVELPIAFKGLEGRTKNAAVLRGVSVNGENVFSRSHVANGGGRSSDRAGIFEWISDGSVLRVPIRSDVTPISITDVEVEVESFVNSVFSLNGAEGCERAVAAGERFVLSVSVVPKPVDVLNNVGSWLDESWVGHERGLYEVDLGQYDTSGDVGTWCGAAVLLRAAQLADVGVFEENFFLYYEDTDLAVRGRGRGWRIVLEPASVVRHIHSASTVEGSEIAAFHIERNRLLLVLRHAPLDDVIREFVRYLLVTASYIRASFAQSIRRRRFPDFNHVGRRLRSFTGALRLLPSSIASRREISSRRFIPRNELRHQIALGSRDSATGDDEDGGLRSSL